MQNELNNLNKAKFCLDCPVCRAARKNQRGIAYAFVKLVDRKVCPACRAYEKETGQLAYEPLDEETNKKLKAET
jgi:transposase-like protein